MSLLAARRARALPRLTPGAYRRVTLVAAVLVAVIIVTGGAVRLTQSGLGCPAWPNCSTGRLTPRAASDSHAMVEFVNRVFTLLVSLAVAAAVLGSFARVPRRRDLTWLSVGLVLGVVGQIVLGGITVLTDLNPVAVMSHFLLSIAVLGDAVVLHVRAGCPDGASLGPAVRPPVLRMGWLLVAVAAVVVVTGTVVTNTGPHAGDRRAHRFDLYLPSVARVHGSSVMVFLGLVLLTLWLATRDGVVSPRMARRLTALLAVLVAQAGVGYWQYFTGVPPLLVGVHIAGATAVWSATLAVLLGCYQPRVVTERADTADRVGGVARRGDVLAST